MSDRLKPLSADLGALFAKLEERAQHRVELSDRVRNALPSPEKEHVLSASYREDTLVVIADCAAWASRIRFAQQELLAQVRGESETQFTKLRVKVGRRSG